MIRTQPRSGQPTGLFASMAAARRRRLDRALRVRAEWAADVSRVAPIGGWPEHRADDPDATWAGCPGAGSARVRDGRPVRQRENGPTARWSAEPVGCRPAGQPAPGR
jgi:hypothetical protein